MQASLAKERQRNGRIKLLALLALFVIPVIAAKVILYMNWYEGGATNKGTLIEPRFTFEQAGLSNPIPESWQLVFIVPEVCDSVCEERWYLLNQSKIALGAYSERVEVALYVSTSSDAKWVEALEIEHKVLVLPEQELPIADQDYLLVDPLGQWVIRYPEVDSEQAVSQSKGLISDVRKILKLSRVG
ncbi:hypotehtical protein [Vibrio sp. JCM 19236]|nr:hypotehtical protein [Vibrio sp. JCM 19236]